VKREKRKKQDISAFLIFHSSLFILPFSFVIPVSHCRLYSLRGFFLRFIIVIANYA